MTTKTAIVTFCIAVTVDETKFDEKFMSEFRQSFYDFDDIDAHVRFLAEMRAREHIEGFASDSLEGYGLLSDLGIKTEMIDAETEIV